MLNIEMTPEQKERMKSSNFELSQPRRVTRFLDFSVIDLELADKFYVCEMYHRQRNTSGELSLRTFAAHHSIASSTFHDWYGYYLHFLETGVIKMGKKRGRKPAIDEYGVEELRKLIMERNVTQRTPDGTEINQLLVQVANTTRERVGRGQNVESLSRTCKRKYLEIAEVEKGKVQHKTHARIVAENDPRNALSMHSLVVAFCRHLPPCMIGNFDATQFIVSQERSDTGFYIKHERAESDSTLTGESTGGLDFAIKYYHLNNAAGFTGVPVFNIADKNMDDSAFEVSKISGLGTNREQSNYGFVCLTKTRACNRAFYSWFAKEVLVPFVNQSRDSIDGEVCQDC